MLHNRMINIIGLTVIFIALLITGCSDSNPVDPGQDMTDNSAVLTGDGSGHSLMGLYSLTFNEIYNSAGECVDFTVDVVPLRTSQLHVNVTPFVKPPNQANLVIHPDGVVTQGLLMEFQVTIQLYNPTAAITGYDVRSIVYPDVIMGEQKVWMERIDGRVTSDGFTNLYSNLGLNPTNPYMTYYSTDAPNEDKDRVFPPQTWQGTTMYLTKIWDHPIANIVFAVDASWPTNCPEAYGSYIEPWPDNAQFYPGGSNELLTVVVFDHQNDIDSVQLDFADWDEPGLVDMVYVSSDPDNNAHIYIYQITQACGGIADTDRSVWLIVNDTADNTNPYYQEIKCPVQNDLQGPVWLDGVGIYEHLSSPHSLLLFYHEAWDPTWPCQYLFWVNDVEPATAGAQFKVENEDTYVGYTKVFASGADDPSPDNLERVYGIILRDGAAFENTEENNYTCTRYGIDARWSRKDNQPAGQDGILGAPAIGDVNGDGVDDIAVGTRDKFVYVYEGNGTGTSDTKLWSYETGGEIQCTPAIVDLTGDGKGEVVIASDDCNIYALDGATGLPVWTYDTGEGWLMHSSPTIVPNLDGDEVPDVVIGTGDGELFALRGAGPTNASDQETQVIWTFEAEGGIASTPAAADVNGDGTWDVCFGAYDTRLYMVDGSDGTEIWNYYVGPGMNNIDCSPILVPINNDNVPDAVFGARDNSGLGGTIFAINGEDGPNGGSEIWIQNQIWGNPRRTVCPVQFNDDGVWDFLVTAYQTEQKSVYMISGADGSILYSTLGLDINADDPFNYAAPIAGEFTGDDHMNFLIARQDGFVDMYCLGDDTLPDEWNGGHLAKLMVSTGTKQEIFGTPACADVDGDGEWELIACNMRGYVYILDLHAPVPADITLRGWTQHSGNAWNTGTPEFDPPQ